MVLIEWNPYRFEYVRNKVLPELHNSVVSQDKFLLGLLETLSHNFVQEVGPELLRLCSSNQSPVSVEENTDELLFNLV